jgi:hypothetical protein
VISTSGSSGIAHSKPRRRGVPGGRPDATGYTFISSFAWFEAGRGSQPGRRT